MDLRYNVLIKSKQNIENKILQMDGEGKLYTKGNFLLIDLCFCSPNFQSFPTGSGRVSASGMGRLRVPSRSATYQIIKNGTSCS